MIEMTLSSRHRIRNSSPGGLRPSTLPLGHGGSPQYWLSHVDGEETFFVSFKPPRPGTEPRTLAWKAAVLTTTLGPPPYGSSAIIKMFSDSAGIIFIRQNLTSMHVRFRRRKTVPALKGLKLCHSCIYGPLVGKGFRNSENQLQMNEK